MAGTFGDRNARVTLAHMAQAWLRPADQITAAEEVGLIVHQEQQTQPEKRDKTRLVQERPDPPLGHDGAGLATPHPAGERRERLTNAARSRWFGSPKEPSQGSSVCPVCRCVRATIDGKWPRANAFGFEQSFNYTHDGQIG
jgi:hypothetical protein